MPNTFKATGVLSLAKDSDKVKAFEEVIADTPNGWDRRILRMRLSTDKGPLYLTLKGFRRHDEGNDLKFSNFENGAYKGLSVIPFKKRFDKAEIAKVHPSSRLTVDTETDPTLRRSLYNAKKEGGDSVYVASEQEHLSKEQIEDRLNESYAKRYDFLSGWDYTAKLKELLEAGHFKNITVTVHGEIKVSVYKDKYYFNYEPNKIQTAMPSDENIATSNILFYYDKDVLSVAEDQNSITLHGFIEFYDSDLKDSAFAPYDILYEINPLDSTEQKERRIDYIKRRFETNGDTVYVMGLVVENVNYAPKRAVSAQDLTEAEKEAIEMGDTTLEKVLASKSGEVREKFVRANLYKEVQSKYINRAVETAVHSAELYGLEPPEEDELPF